MSSWRTEAIEWLREVFPAFDWSKHGHHYRSFDSRSVHGVIGSVVITVMMTSDGVDTLYRVLIGVDEMNGICPTSIGIGHSVKLCYAVNSAMHDVKKKAKRCETVMECLDISPRPAPRPKPVDGFLPYVDKTPTDMCPVELIGEGKWDVLAAKDDRDLFPGVLFE